MHAVLVLLEKLSRGETEMVSLKVAARDALRQYKAERQAANDMAEMLWDAYHILQEVGKYNAARNVREVIRAHNKAIGKE